jgi:hypothetical protein
MTDCTERQPAAPSDGVAGEGREGMSKVSRVMSMSGRGEGREGMPKVSRA